MQNKSTINRKIEQTLIIALDTVNAKQELSGINIKRGYSVYRGQATI